MLRAIFVRASGLKANFVKATLGTALLGWLLLAATTAFAATETWGPGVSGFEWGTSGNWTGGNAVPATGDTLIFDSTGNSSSPSDDNLGNAFSIATLNFVNGANAYTLTSNSGANDQSLALTSSLIDQASGQTETFNFAITGTGTLFMGGPTSSPDGNGGATLVLNANAGFAALTSSINNATGDTLQLGNNSTLTVNGNILVGGYNPTAASTSKLTIAGTTLGTGSLTDTGTTNTLVIGGVTNAPGSALTATLDLSGLNTFSFTGQEADIGGNQSTSTTTPTGNRVVATMTLAAATNTIKVTSTTAGVSVGGGSPSNGGTAVLNLSGTGTNTIWTPTLFIGTVKSNGTVQFGSGSGGSFTLRNAAGTGRAAIVVGSHTGAGTLSAHGTLNLNGHSLDVMASTLTVGADTAASTAGTVSSSVSFDTGTFDVTSIILGQRTGAALGTTTGTLTMGGGILNVNSAGGGSFVLGSNGSSGTGSTTGVFNLSVGTANILTNITVGPTGSGTTGNINFSSGTLNMGSGAVATNFAIGTAAIPVSNFNMPTSGNTGTIQNLGGGGIFANGGSGSTSGLGGLTMGDSGTLILSGNNTYTGTTNVNNGIVQFGSTTPAVNSTINMNGGNVAFSPVALNTYQIGGLGGSGGITLTDTGGINGVTLNIGTAGGSYSGSLTGNGGLKMAGTNGTTVQTLSGINSYKGNTTITSGTLQLSGAQLYNGVSSPGTVLVNGGTLAGSGTISSAVSLTSGTIAPDAFSPLNVNSLNMNGTGGLLFTLNGGSLSEIVVGGNATLTSGSLAFALSGIPSPSASPYTILDDSAGTLSNSLVFSNPYIVSGTQFTVSKVGNTLQVQILSPSNLTWVGNLSSGKWDVNNTQNWNNGTGPSVFKQFDTVTFDNSASPSNTNVNIVAPVTPSALSSIVVTFANDVSHPYVISSTTGNGIGGIGGLTVNSNDGNGTVTLQTVNTYSGNTTVQSGTLILSSGGSIASPNVIVNGGGLTINSTSSAAATAININNNGAVNVNSGGSLTGAGLTVNVANSSGTGFTVASGGIIPVTTNLINNGTTTFGSSQAIATLNGTSSSAVLTQTGTLTVNNGGTYAGAINQSGSGGLTVAGGSLLLTGPSNYTGATTVNLNTTLQIDDGTLNTGSLSSNTAITNNGTLIFARTDSPTIANSISGTGLLEVNANFGTTTLSGNNSSFTGTAGIYSGTLVQGSANALGAGTVALFVGQPEPTPASGISTTTGSLTLANSTAVGSFSALSANTSTTPTSTVTIPTGTTLTVNGAFLIGSSNSSGFTYDNTTNFTGRGSLVVSGTGNFMVGQPSNNAAGAKDTTNSDMSPLTSVSVNTTGIFAVGYGSNSRGLLSLADNTTAGMPANSINATEIDVGNSLSDNNVGQSVLTLGQGTNVLQANTINIGLGKTSGSITWSSGSGSSSSVSIAGTGGGSAAANIIVSGQNSTTSAGGNSSLLLAGHIANVQAGSLAIGENIGNTAGGANGTVTFDTGSFDAGSLTIG
ncbi:MAG TPA: autotransporter-associated beta strand repeat-containing protein, partial [Pirellulales bacterium]|nr:autotransporter-associated beta strand repeat-containing protein [Pirellulales bacterium]